MRLSIFVHRFLLLWLLFNEFAAHLFVTFEFEFYENNVVLLFFCYLKSAQKIVFGIFNEWRKKVNFCHLWEFSAVFHSFNSFFLASACMSNMPWSFIEYQLSLKFSDAWLIFLYDIQKHARLAILTWNGLIFEMKQLSWVDGSRRWLSFCLIIDLICKNKQTWIIVICHNYCSRSVLKNTLKL